MTELTYHDGPELVPPAELLELRSHLSAAPSPEVRRSHLDAIVAQVRSGHRTVWGRVASGAARGTAAAVVTLTITTGLAAAQVLPPPAQRILSSVSDRFTGGADEGEAHTSEPTPDTATALVEEESTTTTERPPRTVVEPPATTTTSTTVVEPEPVVTIPPEPTTTTVPPTTTTVPGLKGPGSEAPEPTAPPADPDPEPTEPEPTEPEPPAGPDEPTEPATPTPVQPVAPTEDRTMRIADGTGQDGGPG